jgi:2-methylisocitrate lyase-like PEP mutase family enzyme
MIGDGKGQGASHGAYRMSLTIAQKRARFAELHASPGCFVIPNPFDIGSAKYLASLGFPALASTSAGMAFAAGKGDGDVDRAFVLSHLRDLADATDLPLNADFEAGFARDAEGVHESVRLCIGAGVSGFSIEDYTGDPRAPLYSASEAVERLRAARAAIDASGETVLLTARSEAILRQAGGLSEALRRLPLYAEAGADVLYVPLVKTPAEVSEVVRVAGKLPVNVLAGWPGFTKRGLEDLGVKRISVGGALARAAWGGFISAAKDIADNGRFDAFADLPTMNDITGAFADKG